MVHNLKVATQCRILLPEGMEQHIRAVGGEPAEDVWVDDHKQLDFLARMQVSKHISIVLDLINLTDEPFRVYEGTPDRPIQEEYYSWWGMLGFTYSF